MKLSEHFSLEEMTRSETAQIRHIINNPSELAIDNLTILCQRVLEPTRKIVGKPLIINSGYRSERLNSAVGGVKSSYHLTGKAADIHADNEEDAMNIAKAALRQRITDTAIVESYLGAAAPKRKYWVHVQWSYAPRHKLMRIDK